MLRRYGGDRVYKTTYQSGLQWNNEQRGKGRFMRFLEVLCAMCIAAFGFVAALVSAPFGTAADRLNRRKARKGYDERRAASLDGEPVSLRGYMSHRRKRAVLIPGGLPVMARFLAVAIAIVMAVSLIIAIPPASVIASSSAVMVLDEDMGIAYEITTLATSVGELLDLYDFQLSVGDIVYPDRTQPIADGQEIRLRRAMSVSTSADGVVRDLRIQGGTVRDALAMSGVTYDQDDIISPPLSSMLTPGMEISLIRVEHVDIVETQRLYYQKRTQKDSSLYIGETAVAQEGKEGEKEVDIRIVYHDGEELYREETGSRVLEMPQHLIVKEGTKARPVKTAVVASTPSKTTTGTKAVTTSTKAGSTSVSNNWYDSAGYKENTYWVFYGDKQYEKKDTLSVKATAYTHTGSRTASGVWPSVGTIAVDKSVIPMGTRIFVPGYGIGIAQDTGGAIKGNKIDVFLNTEGECIKWGAKNVQIYILGKPQPREE